MPSAIAESKSRQPQTPALPGGFMEISYRASMQGQVVHATRNRTAESPPALQNTLTFTMMGMRVAVVRLLILIVISLRVGAAKAPFTFDAMMQLVRIDDPQLSPDSKFVAFTVQTVDMVSNSKPTQIYLVPSGGGLPIKITSDGSQNTRPRWAPDSKRIFFVSNRSNPASAPGLTQIWSENIDGSDARPLTVLPTGADGVTVSPDGELILFTSDVYPACQPAGTRAGADYDVACNKTYHDKDMSAQMNARTYTSLLYRHWNEYRGGTRRHLMIETLNNSFKARDLTPGNRDTPPFSLGGMDSYAFSPDSVQVAFVANTDADLATSTNSDIFIVDAAGGIQRRITTNPGADEAPRFSPDGKSLAYRTQLRSGFESDQWRLGVIDLASGQSHTVADQLDRWVEEFTWSADSQRIFFTVEDHGMVPLLMAAVSGGEIRTIVEGATSVGAMQFSRDDKIMVYLEQSGSAPPQIKMVTSKGGSGIQLSRLNDAITSSYELTPLEKFDSEGSDGFKVQTFIVKPPNFDASKKYPVLFLIHGGPQGAWGESWSYRWNPQVFAAAGYVVVMPNPHGSTGYGQNFTDAVSGDWGGRAYRDILAVADNIGSLPYVDQNRMAAAGGSYGGYMIDWILGHNHPFRALVSHAGVYDLRSEAGTTEELWFVKWEFKGFPWESPATYDQWSPNLFVDKFHTPTLITQGELDYRVPIGQSQELFTALQERHVPSELILFPDEGHWILKPQNSRYWYAKVIEWLNRYTKAPPVQTAPATTK